VLRHFAFFGRWYYDFETDRDVELFGGIEYNDCCWQVRVVGRRFLSAPGSALVDDTEEDAGVYLQIVFKGLAGIGGRIDSLMENGIRGFVPEEN
jgi:LPS-assembly protein